MPSLIRMLAGLISRWMIYLRASSMNPLTMCLSTFTAICSGIVLYWLMSCFRSPCPQYSVIMYVLFAVWNISRSLRQLILSSFFITWISFLRRKIWTSFFIVFMSKTFTATISPVLLFFPLKTFEEKPFPISSVS